jgi:hypothetical protein
MLQKKKILSIFSDGSSTFSCFSNYFLKNNFIFSKKDFVNLKKKSNKKINLESKSNYKNKYLTN